MSNESSFVAVTHVMADTQPGVRIHYVCAGDGERTVVLLHGFPQTWWEWRRVMPALVQAGFHVIAPDYRGAGQSWRPLGGYDKLTMAEDIDRLVREQLRIRGSIALIGHDIGRCPSLPLAARRAPRDPLSRR
jgi:pimeloyl-ACP methyl ester carboxylesterase